MVSVDVKHHVYLPQLKNKIQLQLFIIPGFLMQLDLTKIPKIGAKTLNLTNISYSKSCLNSLTENIRFFIFFTPLNLANNL